MPARIEVELWQSNLMNADAVAKVLGIGIDELVSKCLEGSTTLLGSGKNSEIFTPKGSTTPEAVAS